jgi:Spy/CpxP family protein refolding chaperone
MSRFTGRVLGSLAALAIVVALAQVAEAQREGGRRGGRGFGRMGFGVSPVQLAAESEEVQGALKLTDDQKTKIVEINDELTDARRDLFQGGGGSREEREKLNADAAAKLAEVLDEGQQKRLMGIQIQVNGANSLLDSAIAKVLNVTDDQQTQLSEVRDDNMEAMGEAMRDLRDQDLSREEMTAKMQELRTESDKKLLAVLTSDQQTQYEELKGDPVEVDMSQFRFGGGRGFGGGGGRGRDRDRGDRNDNDNNS